MGRKKIKTPWQDLSQVQREVLVAMRKGDVFKAAGLWCVTLQALYMMGYVVQHAMTLREYRISVKGLELVEKYGDEKPLIEEKEEETAGGPGPVNQ